MRRKVVLAFVAAIILVTLLPSLAFAQEPPALPKVNAVAVDANAAQVDDNETLVAALRGQRPSGTARATGYAIVTTPALAESGAAAEFAQFKESEGFEVYTVTPEDWAGFNGAEEADKLQALLKARRAEWNLGYLMIIGTPAAIPMKALYPSAGQHDADWKTPSDMYYSDLTSKWDSDGDGYAGEYGQDAVDYSAEILVGRIPFVDEKIVSDILRKTMVYESSGGEWRKRALLAMPLIDVGNGGSVVTDAGHLGAAMDGYLKQAGWATTRLYEEGATTLQHDGALNRDSLAAEWTEGYGLVAWWSHGSSTGAYRTVWENGKSTRKAFADIYHAQSLATERQPIVFQNACDSGVPQTSSLAAQTLKYGAVATVAATQAVWYRTAWKNVSDGGAPTFAYNFGRELVANGQTVGAALARAREAHAAKYITAAGQQQTVLAFNLYGDPSLQMTPRPRSKMVNLPVRKGWNLLSMPALPQPLPVEQALASIAGKYQLVHTYVAADTANPWKTYIPAQSENSLTELRGLQGFWLMATEDCTLTVQVSGTLIASANEVALEEGWNLVGFPGVAAATMSEGLRGVTGVVTEVQTISSDGEGTWLVYNAETNTLTTLEPGKGYWVYAATATIWTTD